MSIDKSAPLTGVEMPFDQDEIIVSKTDLSGKITYGNRTFYKFAGLDETQCIGVQHNLVRHPDMPRAVFDLAWESLANGEEVFAYVVNRSANGDHYWVFAHMTPSRDMSGNVGGYHSNRRKPNKRVIDEHIIPLYRKLKEVEVADPSPKEGMAKARTMISEALGPNIAAVNQQLFAMGV